jgi:hypothetical protein
MEGALGFFLEVAGCACILIKLLIDLKEKLLDTGTNSAVINLKFLWFWLENNQTFILQQIPPRCRIYNFTKKGYLWDSYVQKKSSYKMFTILATNYHMVFGTSSKAFPVMELLWIPFKRVLISWRILTIRLSPWAFASLPPYFTTHGKTPSLSSASNNPIINYLKFFLVSLHVCFWSSGPEGRDILQNINFLCIEQSSVRTQQLNFLRLLQGTKNLLSQFESNS